MLPSMNINEKLKKSGEKKTEISPMINITYMLKWYKI